jgi:two-component system nitrogen regulation response regulator NtrX
VAKKILFVDDELDWRGIVATALEDVGHQVIAAKDASEAMQQTEGVVLSLIILDLNLGGEDGLMLMKFLRRNHPGVPIMLFTGMEHDESAIKRMLLQGASLYLRKGSIQDLIQAVERLVR